MKKLSILLMFLLGLTVITSSCKKKGCMDSTASNYSAEAKKDDGSCNYPVAITGGLNIKVQLEGTTGYMQDAPIGLSASLEDLDNNIFLQDLITDANGNANFGQLNPGNYYYDCLPTIGGVTYYGAGSVQIIAGNDLDLTLTLTADGGSGGSGSGTIQAYVYAMAGYPYQSYVYVYNSQTAFTNDSPTYTVLFDGSGTAAEFLNVPVGHYYIDTDYDLMDITGAINMGNYAELDVTENGSYTVTFTLM